VISTFDRWLSHIELLLAGLAALLMFAIMTIVAIDVAARYLLNSPLSWSYDLISLYLMTALFYFALSRTFAEGAHISVDIAQYYLAEDMRRLCQIAYAIPAAVLFMIIVWLGAERTLDDFRTGAATAGAVLWPSWIADVMVPIGAGLLSLRLVLHVAAHALSLLCGRDLVELPALSGTVQSVERSGFE
jgi:TRAP-type C4-dicarboxylate transport system permease small subunit